jgi:hypothetical protein
MNSCNCGYEKVPVLHGAVIEGIATCMCQLTGRVMSQLNPKYGNPITAFVGTALVVAGNAEFNDLAISLLKGKIVLSTIQIINFYMSVACTI